MMGLRIKLERENRIDAVVCLDPGSRRAPDKGVVTLSIITDRGSQIVELNKLEAETVANALKAAVR